jgi:putative transposase
MPRGPRLDIEGGLYHVIARGVERRPIFRDDTDRQSFLRRLQMVAGEEGLQVFAYLLLDNHVHLVVRRGAIALGQCMRRLLTGHSVMFNRRHRRRGHLFQNRYHAVLCEADNYLLQLVRYVHRNPVRAGVVLDPAAYRWSSHAAYLSRRCPAWLETKTVLEMVGGRAAYRRFMQEGDGEGRRADLCGRTDRHEGGDGPWVWFGGQILGDERFARRSVRAGRQRELQRELDRGRAQDLPRLAKEVAKRHGVDLRALRGPGRSRAVSAARRALVWAAVGRGMRPVDLSRYLGVSRAAVTAQRRTQLGTPSD